MRIQRIRLSVQKYDLIVTYKPQKQLLVGDVLSRAYLKDMAKNDIQDINTQMCLIEETLPLSIENEEDFLIEITKYITMQSLAKYIMERWPKEKNRVQDEIRMYYNFAEDLNIISGLIFKCINLVVPELLSIKC